MTVAVPRHDSPGAIAQEFVPTLLDDLIGTVKSVERSPRMFNVAMNEACGNVHATLSVNPTGSRLETWEAVTSAMQVTSAAFAAASTAEATVTCRIAHEIRTIPATGPQYYANAGNWFTAFCYAVVCRDQARLDQLCAVPLDLLRSSGATGGDEFLYLWVESLQTYWREEPGLFEKLTATIEASSPEVAVHVDRMLLQYVLYQPIHLFKFFVTQDHDGFNKALAEALELHKAYWTEENRAEEWDGYLALGPLAMACLARDAGFPIDVESDYIPKHLLQHDWAGEFEI